MINTQTQRQLITSYTISSNIRVKNEGKLEVFTAWLDWIKVSIQLQMGTGIQYKMTDGAISKALW